jgi:hypothetical protein
LTSHNAFILLRERELRRLTLLYLGFSRTVPGTRIGWETRA